MVIMKKRCDHLFYVCCLVILLYIFPVAAYSTLHYFEANSGERVKDEFTDLDAISASLLHCANLCAIDESCKSASYHDEYGPCLLSTYRVDGPANQGRLITGQSWVVLSKRDGNIPAATTDKQSASTSTDANVPVTTTDQQSAIRPSLTPTVT